jgi:hypothetical protein
MIWLKNAVSMSYHFETRTAEVVFRAGQPINAQELQAYFDGATDNRIHILSVTVGDDAPLIWERSAAGWTQKG